MSLNFVKTINSMKFYSHKKGFVRTNMFYKEHALAYPNNSLMTRGILEAISSTVIYKTCGIKKTIYIDTSS